MRSLAFAALLLLPALAPTLTHAADKTTQQSITLPSGPFPFTATVETIRLANERGEPQAEIVATAFLHDLSPREAGGGAPRPVTFVFNGGPGSASAWLDMGAVGPWRVPLRFAPTVTPGQDAAPVDNAETWLPFTDLVFIDPVGTGYSRVVATGDAARPFETVDGDIDYLASTVRRWLEAHNRLLSPKFILGESYGGFRGPRLARTLLDGQGVGINGLVLVSPVLDFNGFQAPYNPMRSVAALPALAAAARHATSRGDVADAEEYARSGYLADLLRGPRDAAALDRIVARTAALTGLSPDLLRRRGGHLDGGVATRDRVPGQVASPYDITITVPSAFPESDFGNTPDPVLDGLRAPFTAAMLTIYRRLDWQPDGAPARQYELLNEAVNRAWDYGRSNVRPQSLTALRQYLAIDGTARVLVAHGLYDVVTPYFTDVLALDGVPAIGAADRLTLRAYPGGHMFYIDDASRAALRDDAAALVKAALAARAAAAATAPPGPTDPPAPQTPTTPASR